MQPVLDRRKAVLVLASLTAIGCQTQRRLTIGTPDPGMIGRACSSLPSRILLPCTVKISHSDARFDPGAAYVFPLKPVLERAFQDAAWEVFHTPRGGTLNAFELEVTPSKSVLERHDQRGVYQCWAMVSLRSPFGDILRSGQVHAQTEGELTEGQGELPSSVWQAIYDLAADSVQQAASDPQVRLEAQKYLRDVESGRRAAAVMAPAPVPTGQIGKRWAVVVGVSKYCHADGDKLTSLSFAHRDAETFAEFLRSSAGGGFDDVTLLTDEQATFSGMQAALRKVLSRTSHRDLVVLYFAGHGHPDPFDNKSYYLLPHDAKPSDVAGTGYPMSDMLARVRAKRAVMFVDACYSGLSASRVETRTLKIRAVPKYLPAVDKSYPQGTFVLAASDKDELSHAGDLWGGGHGVFTYYLLNGLRGQADANRDRSVTLTELKAYVCDHVKRATKGRQNPTPFGTLDLPLAVNVASARLDVPSALLGRRQYAAAMPPFSIFTHNSFLSAGLRTERR